MGGSRGAVMLRFRDQAWHHLARRRHCLGVRAFSTTTGTASHCITSDFGLSSGCQMHPEVQQAQECDDCGMLAGAKEVRINLWSAPRCASTSLMYVLFSRAIPLFLLLLLNLCASLGAVVESHSTCVFSHADAHQFSAPCLQPCITRVR